MTSSNQHKELLAQARCTVDRLQPVNPMTLSPDSLSALDYARGLLSLEEQLEAAQREIGVLTFAAENRWQRMEEAEEQLESEQAIPRVTCAARDSDGKPFDTVKLLGDEEAVQAVIGMREQKERLDVAIQDVLDVYEAARAIPQWATVEFAIDQRVKLADAMHALRLAAASNTRDSS